MEAVGRGAGPSGNPAALVTPRLDAGLGPPARLFAQAFRRATQLYEDIPGAILGRGVLQLAMSSQDADRFGRIAAADLFEPGALTLISPQAAGARLAEPAPAALHQAGALLVDPAAILAAWAGDHLPARVATMTSDNGGWTLSDATGAVIFHADAVIVAAGLQACELAKGFSLEPVRGQLSWAPQVMDGPPAVAWGGYAAATPYGLMFGATHDRGDLDVEVRDADHARNLENLARALPAAAACLAGQLLRARVSIRATTTDRLPLAGPAPDAPDGLHLLTGFGSRGFSMAPLLAEHVAALAVEAPSPLPRVLAAAVDPGRYDRRTR